MLPASKHKYTAGCSILIKGITAQREYLNRENQPVESVIKAHAAESPPASTMQCTGSQWRLNSHKQLAYTAYIFLIH